MLSSPLRLPRSSVVWCLGSALALAVAILTFVACVGDDPNLGGTSSGTSGDPQQDGGPGSSSGADGSSSGGDGPPTCTSLACADPSTLKECDGKTTTCTFGCENANGAAPAHCKVVHPSGLVLPSDLATPGAQAIVVMQSTKFVTDTGEIQNRRAANADPLQLEVKDGIGFRLAGDGQGHKTAIWTFDSLEIPAGVTINFTSTNPVALVAAKAITIVGVVDARGYSIATNVLCGDANPGPGGFAGGADPFGNGVGPGGGLAAEPTVGSSSLGGPGGGGNGGIGGKGGAGFDTINFRGGDGGVAYQLPILVPLTGGSGGGGSGSSKGGGGGGAIQLVAAETITIGGGAVVGGVTAGGCNGGSGFFGSTGGGGGAGGSIVIETRTLSIVANGRIGATGGGGASGGGSASAPGQFDFGGQGGGGTASYGQGGGGGSGHPNTAGFLGMNAKTTGSSGGGAGGGSTGRIRINNRTGTFTAPLNSIAPELGIATNPPATVGTLDVR